MNFDYNETKVCKKCGRELSLDKFGINHNYTRNVWLMYLQMEAIM